MKTNKDKKEKIFFIVCYGFQNLKVTFFCQVNNKQEQEKTRTTE